MKAIDATRIENALGLALRFHQGQRDKSGAPYVLHLLSVAMKAENAIVMQAALLHDLLEDTDAKKEDLVAADIDPAAIEAIELLTHDLSETYASYVIRLKRNAIAKAAKLLDLHDNYRLDRVAYRLQHRESDAKRIQKYILSKQFLSDEISEECYAQAMQELE